MNAPLPRVSVCIPTFDSAAVLRDALASAQAQQYPNLEIVVLDNASSDETPALVAEASADDPRMRYIRHPANIGMAGNFTACVEQAHGEYVLILCADDMLEPEAVTALAGALAGHPDATLAVGTRIIVNAELREIGRRRTRSSDMVVDGRALARECFVVGNVIGEPSAVMFRRDAVKVPFDPAYSQLIDLQMWLHLLETGRAAVLAREVSRIRQHGGQATRTNARAGRIVADKRRLFQSVAPALAPTLSLSERLRWDARMASSVARAGRHGRYIDASAIREVFSPGAFASLMVPAARFAWRVIDLAAGNRA